MTVKETLHENVLDRLNLTVLEAAAYLATADEHRSDGRQNAHGILAQLVFWHEEYLKIAQALVEHRRPELRVGTFDQLNQMARSHFAGRSMTMLAYDLSCLQKQFDVALHQLPDWTIDFPIKEGGESRPLAQRLEEIETHIHQHILRLKQGH